MEQLEAIKFSDSHIEFKRREDISRLMELLEQGNNFIIYHVVGDKTKGQLILASDLLGRVRAGDTLITSEEEHK